MTSPTSSRIYICNACTTKISPDSPRYFCLQCGHLDYCVKCARRGTIWKDILGKWLPTHERIAPSDPEIAPCEFCDHQEHSRDNELSQHILAQEPYNTHHINFISQVKSLKSVNLLVDHALRYYSNRVSIQSVKEGLWRYQDLLDTITNLQIGLMMKFPALANRCTENSAKWVAQPQCDVIIWGANCMAWRLCDLMALRAGWKVIVAPNREAALSALKWKNTHPVQRDCMGKELKSTHRGNHVKLLFGPESIIGSEEIKALEAHVRRISLLPNPEEDTEHRVTDSLRPQRKRVAIHEVVFDSELWHEILDLGAQTYKAYQGPSMWGVIRRLMDPKKVTHYDLVSHCRFPAEKNPNDTVSVLFTSGSTGSSKGVAISNESFFNSLCGVSSFDRKIICVSWLPLHHATDRNMCLKTLFNGGLVQVFDPEEEDILSFVSKVRPTSFLSTPELFNMLYFRYKEARSRIQDESQLADFDKRYFEHLQMHVFGGRIRSVVTGGASTPKCVLDFLFDVFGWRISEGYGTTEANGIASDNRLLDGVQYKIVDVPEMGYISDVGDEFTKIGELCVKTDEMLTGYIREDGSIQSAVDDEGYYHTGDIVEISLVSGTTKVKVIDRRNHIFKLSAGEFVCPEKIQGVLMRSALVRQVFVYGRSTSAYLVAVVIPAMELAEGTGTEWKHSLIERLKIDFARLAREHGLAPYEVPQEILIDTEPFTTENGLLTPTRKVMRRAVEEKYKSQLEELYEKENLLGRVQGLISCVLESNVEDDMQQCSLVDLGVDSIQFIQFRQEVARHMGCQLPLDMISKTLGEIMSYIRDAQEEHVFVAANNAAVNWDAEQQLGEELMFDKSYPVTTSTAQNKTVLLTGATGYLGVFLLHELLSQQNVKKVVCLIRATSQEAAHEKLTQHLSKMHLSNISLNKCEILVADLQQPQFGLSHEQYESLLSEVHSIYHCAAHVNSVLSYSDLRESNVQSVRQMIQFAHSAPSHIPHIHFISTIGFMLTAGRIKIRKVVREQDPLPLDVIARLGGYNQSKLIAETLLLEAARRGCPVSIYRPSFIGEATQNGTPNVSDWISRLIKVCIEMKACPDVSRELDMAPVDYAARMIVGIGELREANKNLPATFHIANPHHRIKLREFIAHKLREKLGGDDFRELSEQVFTEEMHEKYASMRLLFPHGLNHDSDTQIDATNVEQHAGLGRKYSWEYCKRI